MHFGRSTIFGTIVGIATIGVISILHFDRLKQDAFLMLATLTLGTSSGFLFSSFGLMKGKTSEESQIGSFGLVSAFSITLFIFGGASFFFAWSNNFTATIILLATTFLIFIGLFFLLNYSNTRLDQISTEKSYQSRHALWAIALEELARRSRSSELKHALSTRAAACRYHPRDAAGEAILEGEINGCIEHIHALSDSDDEFLVMTALADLDRLFDQRASLIKRSRTKI